MRYFFRSEVHAPFFNPARVGSEVDPLLTLTSPTASDAGNAKKQFYFKEDALKHVHSLYCNNRNVHTYCTYCTVLCTIYFRAPILFQPCLLLPLILILILFLSYLLSNEIAYPSGIILSRYYEQ